MPQLVEGRAGHEDLHLAAFGGKDPGVPAVDVGFGVAAGAWRSVWVVTAGEYGRREGLFAVETEQEAADLNAAGHGDDYFELQLLAPGVTPAMVRTWTGWLSAPGLEPVYKEEDVYPWQSPGPCDDQSLPGGHGQWVEGTDRAAVVAATEAWAQRCRARAGLEDGGSDKP